MDKNDNDKPDLMEKVVVSPPASAKNETQVGVLDLSLEQLSSEIIGEYQHSAPVKMPNREELTVRLVNISLLQRLDELRGDVTLLQTILWTIIGILLGFVTSLWGSDQAISQIDKHSWGMLTLLCAFTGVFGYLTKRASNRAENLRAKLFKPENNETT